MGYIKNNYLVEITEIEDNFQYTILLKGEEELGNFLISFNKEKYQVTKDIITLTGYINEDWKMFVKKEKNVELGKKGEDGNVSK